MEDNIHIHNHPWWKGAVIYQIYPRSYKDSNGSGVGDLKGVLEKVEYIASLGVDAVWLNPFFPSPNDDGGYDISDYTGIHPDFGDMDDFDALLKALHQRGIKLIIDLVLNHSSDEHPWFVESKKSKDNPYRDYYFWSPGKNGGPPNNWPSFFGGSAWQLDEATGEYYLHLFSRKQPDLNWEHTPLRQELKELMRFWLDKGVDGLRLDVISCISKRISFPDAETTNFHEIIRDSFSNGPRMKEFIREMRKEVWDQYDTFTIGEGPGITPEGAMDYLDHEDGLKIIFHFDHMILDQGPGGRFDPVPWKLSDFKSIFKQWDDALGNYGWTSVFLGNHDYPRMVSRWGDDKEYRVESSKMLITLLLTMRGTPFIFQGDEIGMTNFLLNHVSESKDIETHAGWKQAHENGMSEEAFLRIANSSGRDSARSPMQWDDSDQAGFTSGIPWMGLNLNKNEINVAMEESDPDAVLHYFRRMISIRKESEVLKYGKLELVEVGAIPLFIFHRVLANVKWTIALNFSAQTIELPFDVTHGMELIISNYRTSMSGDIRPWEARVYKEEG